MPDVLVSPPPKVIAEAIAAARRSPCAKSRRGVAVYSAAPGYPPVVVGVGFNSQPAGLPCSRDEHCFATCSARCVHAERRAIRATAQFCAARWDLLDAVHVKLDAAGELVAGGGPSCAECAKEVLDAGLGGFWLFERSLIEPDHWVRYSAEEFHRETLEACGLSR